MLGVYACHHRALWEDTADPEHAVLFVCRLLLRTQKVQCLPNRYRTTKEILAATDGEFWWALTVATFSAGAMNSFWQGQRPLPNTGPKYLFTRAARFKTIHLGTKDKNRVQNAIKKFCATLT